MSGSTKLPYIMQPGMIVKVLGKIREAKSPERFTLDFLQTKLGFKGGNYRQFIPLAKKLGLLNSDATPTDLYKSLRNPTSSRAAMAEAMRRGYRELFERNEFIGTAKKDEVKGMVVEISGREPTDRVVNLICQTFEILRGEADFEAKLTRDNDGDNEDKEASGQKGDGADQVGDRLPFDLRLGYTINLVLPKTDDPAVFNAIFRALGENLLRR